MKTNTKLGILLLVAFTIRLVWLLCTDNYVDGDSPHRLYQAYFWLKHPSFFPNADWLPMHYYFLGGIIKLSGDAVLVPRIVYMLLSVLTILPLYIFFKNEFDEKIAFYSALCFSLLHSQILISSLSLTDVPFAFLLFCGLCALQQIILRKKNNYLIVAVICFSAANLFRFEGWVYSAVAAVWLFLQTRNIKQVVLFCLLIAIAPVWVMAETYQLTGNPLYGITNSDKEVTGTIAYDALSLPERLSGIWLGFPPLLLFVLPFAVRHVKTTRGRYYLLLALVPFGVAFYKVLTSTLMPNTRYFVVYSAFLIPLVLPVYFDWHRKIAQRIKLGLFMLMLIAVPEILIGGLYVYIMTHYQQNLSYARGFMESAAYVKKNIPHARLLLDCDVDAAAQAWMVYADMPLLETSEYSKKGVAGLLKERGYRDKNLTDTVLIQSIKDGGITDVVLFNSNELNVFLHLDADTETSQGLIFTRHFEENGFSVYHISETDDQTDSLILITR